jgi:hypothetical protein
VKVEEIKLPHKGEKEGEEEEEEEEEVVSMELEGTETTSSQMQEIYDEEEKFVQVRAAMRLQSFTLCHRNWISPNQRKKMPKGKSPSTN